MIIDAHTHIFHPEMIGSRDSFTADQAFQLLYGDKKSGMADAADLLRYMDECSIDAAVAMAFPWHKEEHCSMHNEYMASVMRENSGRVYCFGMVAVNSGRGDVRRQVRDIKDSGLAGIGELGFYAGGFTPANSQFLRHVLEAAGAEELPVCLHVNEPVGHMYPGKYQPRLDELFMILKEFGGVRIMLAHWGGGLFMYELMPEVRDALGNVFYDTAATPYLYSPGIYNAAVNSAGAGKIIFGSDFPLLGIKRYKAGIDALAGDDAEKIMHLNAAALLRI